MRSYHTHPHFKGKKSKVYYYIEEETRTTSSVVLVKLYQKKKNGTDAFLALVLKYVRYDRWQKLLKDSAEILQNRR